MKNNKTVVIGERKINKVPYYKKGDKEMLAAREVLKIEKALRLMKKEGVVEMDYEEVIELK